MNNNKIQVAVRLKPLCDQDNDEYGNPLRTIGGNTIVYDGTGLPEGVRGSQPFSYTFSSVFSTDSQTNEIYEKAVDDMIKGTLDGFNTTVFAYGQTSSGKTFTMRGTNEEPGIIPLSLEKIFSLIAREISKQYTVRVSYMEIYNEIITDLLCTGGTNLKIHETVDRGIFVGDLSEEIVTCYEQAYCLMLKGEERRHIGRTNMNEYSSRSHTILRIMIECKEKINPDAIQDIVGKEGEGLSTGGEQGALDGLGIDDLSKIQISCLNLVDLAGSERVKTTGAEGVRLKEGSHINKSLLTLGTVISKLSDISNGNGEGVHVPFRDSKLTRILQPALGGNSNTLIVCTVNSHSKYFDESLSTLKFALRATMIENRPERNEILSTGALVNRYKREILLLKQEVNDLRSISENTERIKRIMVSSLDYQNSPKKQKMARRRTWFPTFRSVEKGEDTSEMEDKENEHGYNLNSKSVSEDGLERESEILKCKKIINELNEKILSERENHSKLRMELDELQDGYLKLMVKNEELNSLYSLTCKEREELRQENSNNLDHLKEVLGETRSYKELLNKNQEDIERLDALVLDMRQKSEGIYEEKCKLEKMVEELNERCKGYEQLADEHKLYLEENVFLNERLEEIVKENSDMAERMSKLSGPLKDNIDSGDSEGIHQIDHSEVERVKHVISEKEEEITEMRNSLKQKDEEINTMKNMMRNKEDFYLSSIEEKCKEMEISKNEEIAKIQAIAGEQAAGFDEIIRSNESEIAILRGRIKEVEDLQSRCREDADSLLEKNRDLANTNEKNNGVLHQLYEEIKRKSEICKDLEERMEVNKDTVETNRIMVKRYVDYLESRIDSFYRPSKMSEMNDNLHATL